MARSRGLRNEQGLALAFVDAATLPDHAYERHIWRTGQVPTRTSGDGAWHDLRIPMSAFAAADLTAIVDPLVLVDEIATAGDALLIDNLYLTKEAL